MADTIFTGQTPATDELDFITHFFGMEFTVSSASDATAGRAWVPAAGRPPTFFWQLWRVSDTAMLAEVNLNDAGFGTPTAGTWMSFSSSDFITPGNVALSTGVSYVEGLFSDDGHFVYTGSASFPIGTGIISSSQGRFKTGGLRTDFPNGTHSVYGFGDISVDVAGAAATGLQKILSPVGAVHRAGSW
ncbi:MAG TPA: hypothetical protein DGT23_35295 [Micromonosporaceae bacterium]|nr:hypothetical protein [Micromonosporaceae bacterium]